jgi:NADH dehydrogenase [ubiquinone] 1 alpha subcomplex assembly factor 7
MVDFLADPGAADVTANVDFSLLTRATEGFAKTHGPITQSEFLKAMGIQTRMMMLLNKADATMRKEIVASYERLTGIQDHQMGQIYKFMAMTPLSVKESPYPFSLRSSIQQTVDSSEK